MQRGCNLHEACLQTEQPYQAVYQKCQRDDLYFKKIQAEIDFPVIEARKVWLAKIQEGDYQASRDYLRAKRKDEFAEKDFTDVNNLNDTQVIEEMEKDAEAAIF